MAKKPEQDQHSGERRARSDGSVTQRPDGTWMGQVSLGYDVEGNRVRKTVYGPTKRDVERQVRDLVARQTVGVGVAAREVTVADLAARWLAEVVEPHLRPKTYRSYEPMTRLHIVPGLGRYKVSALEPAVLDRFFRAKLKSGLSAQSVRTMRGLVRILYH